MGRKAKKSGGGYPDKKASISEESVEVVEAEEEEHEEEEDEEEKVDLCDEKNDATRSFKQVLVQLFGRFDVDKDKLLSEAELKAFSREANEDEREFTVEEIEEMKEFFDWTELGPNGVGGLTLRGWMQMYVTQTAADEDETWKDLRRLGYTNQLKLVSEQTKRPHSAALRAALDRFVTLASGNDIQAFVKAFVATDIEEEDRTAFAEDLRRDDCKQLKELLEELKCCASGLGVFKIEEKKEKEGAEKSPVTIHFRSPTPGAENVDRAVVFVRDAGEWRAEG